MWISQLRDTARDSVLDFTWRQWAQIGLSVHAHAADLWAIDPEALILLTIEVARRDPRLFDEMMDWITRNRRLLTLQRLANLGPRFPVDPALVEAVLESTGAARHDHRKASSDLDALDRNDLIPVFSPSVLAFVSQPDLTFAAHGFLRPRTHLSGKSGRPDVLSPACLAFRLRLLFGPGSRSEVTRILLTHRDGGLDAARIADEAAFAKRNVADTLAALTDAEAVVARWVGNERIFSADQQLWVDFLSTGASRAELPAFVSWTHLLPLALHIQAWLEQEADNAGSDYLVSSRARDLTAHLGHSLQKVGVALPPPARGSQFIPGFIRTVESVLALLRPQ